MTRTPPGLTPLRAPFELKEAEKRLDGCHRLTTPACDLVGCAGYTSAQRVERAILFGRRGYRSGFVTRFGDSQKLPDLLAVGDALRVILTHQTVAARRGRTGYL